MNSLVKVAPAASHQAIADWQREIPQRFFDRGAKLIRSVRAYQSARNPIVRKIAVARWMFWSAVSGADIPLNTTIGGGFMLPHPNGVVVHPNAVIGVNCMLMQQVTLGSNGVDKRVPQLGHGVFIGAGAKVVGGVRIPPNTCIGCNAVVNKTLTKQPQKLWAGIPAKLK